ncbi:MAG TPA: 6-phosphogluconolactonase [Candidatus Binataceae bacterium]|nr:6-phosphogluconolactonase [Candidatus Binataceae bacterium]
MGERKIIVLERPDLLYVRAAEEIAHLAGEAICTHGEFCIALSGGSTPASVYELLATRFHFSVSWKDVQFFWGDERCVGPDDALSNFAMANRTMLSKLNLKPEQVHRMRGELEPEAGARAYEEELRRAFALKPGELPRFDLVLLGLGDNRHTLSLFPGDPAIHETRKMVAAVDVDAEPRRRLTLTAAVVNNAQRVMFLAAGESKACAVKDVIEGPRDPDKYPAQAIDPEDGELIWVLDRAAASLLEGR